MPSVLGPGVCTYFLMVVLVAVVLRYKAQCIDCRVKCAHAIISMVQGSVHRLPSSCACISMLQGSVHNC